MQTQAQTYFGAWSAYAGMKKDFSTYNYVAHHGGDYDRYTPPDDFPPPDVILFASYGGASYKGDALVLFERDGKLFEVHGSHCSCYGLEGQWEPAEVTWPALRLRVDKEENRASRMSTTHTLLHDHEDDARTAFAALVKAHA